MPIAADAALRRDGASAGGKFVKGGTPAAIARLRPGSFFLAARQAGAAFKYAHCGIIVKRRRAIT